MDIFRTPGASLEGADKKKFDETKELVDSATNDFLVRADWNANMSCVDKINSIHNTITLNEVMFLLRKKISSKSTQTVGLTMQLIGSLVNNCGLRFHTAMNEEKFIRAIGDAIRYFSNRSGLESKEVTDNSLDLVQSWGEAFLPKRKQFYHIVDLYFTLRKEGLPFKAQQFDPSRVPIFTDNNGTPKTGDETDAILAAALQSSLEIELQQEEAEIKRRQQNNRDTTGKYSDNPHRYREEQYHDNPSGITTQPSQGSSSSSSTAQEVESLHSCMGILKDLILAATHQMDFRNNEVAQEVLAQLLSYQSKMPSLIEHALMSDAEGVETLIALNEASQSLCSIYNKIKSCEINLVEGQRQTRTVTWGGETQQESVKPSLQIVTEHTSRHTTVQQTADGSTDLLGMGDYSPYKRTTPSSGHPPVHHSVAQHAMAVQSSGAHHSPGRHSPTHYSPHRSPPGHTQAHHSPSKPPVGYHTSHPEYPAEYPIAPTKPAGIRIPPPGQHGHSHGVHHPTAGIKAPSPVNTQGAHYSTMKAPSPVHDQGVHYSTLKLPSPVNAHGGHYSNAMNVPSPIHGVPPVMHARVPVHVHVPTPNPPVTAVKSRQDEVITPTNGDPFAPDALDALFGSGPPPAQPSQKSPTKATQQRPPPPPVGSPEVTGKILPQPADHFAPEALDALFDTKPPAPAVSGVKADPFSDAALDALFDTPAPPVYQHGGHHYAAQQHPNYPPAPPAYGQPHPQCHAAAHPAGGYPAHPQAGYPGHPPQYQPQHQQQHHAQYPPQYQQQHQHQHQHQQHTQHTQQSQQAPTANPFDLLDS